jgi:hypothetical protein
VRGSENRIVAFADPDRRSISSKLSTEEDQQFSLCRARSRE